MRTMASLTTLLLSTGVICACGGGAGEIPPPTPTPTPTPTPVPHYYLDFGTAFPGLPDTYAGAAGSAGRWVDVPLGTTNALIDVNGNATTASVTVLGASATWGTETTTDSTLIRDSIVSDQVAFQPFEVVLTGLPVGTYDVYYYFHSPISGLQVQGNPIQLAGGDPEALGAQGTNWDVVRVAVAGTGTSIGILDLDPNPDEGLSGIQIVPVP